MMRVKLLARGAVVGLCLLLLWRADPAAAQSAARCESMPLSVGTLADASNAAARLHRLLESENRRVAVIARVGDDISERGLKYTHAAFAWRGHPRGDWTVVHVLNHCGSARAGFFEQGLLNFFLDDLHNMDVWVMTPPPALQAALSETLADGTARRLFMPRYNMVAHPRSTRFQNSNQWLLEVLAVAQSRRDGRAVAGRAAAQRYYSRRGYLGTRLRAGFFEALFADLFASNIRLSDQRENGPGRADIEVVTVRSLYYYLRRTGDLQSAEELTAP